MIDKSNSKCFKLFLVVISTNFLNNLYAGGFQMHEQNASLGDVHAGYAVSAQDASVSFYNSALLTEITRSKATSSAVTAANMVRFKGTTSLETYPSMGVSDPARVDAGSATTRGVHVIPAMHYAIPINNKFAFGLSIASPFAAEISWPDQKFTKYNSTLNGIKTINFSPSLAYKYNEYFSLGFGFDVQHATMNINKVVGSSYDVFRVQENMQSINLYDSLVTNNLSSTGLGWHWGLSLKPNRDLKLGFHYRSRIDHNAQGKSKLKGRLAGDFQSKLMVYNHDNKNYRDYSFGSEDVNKSNKLKAKIKIPQSMALSMEYNPIYSLKLLSTIVYTNWSVVDSFDLKNVPGAFLTEGSANIPNIDIVKSPLKLKDTYTFLSGINYQYNNNLVLKLGFGYDQTPTNNKYRDLKMPDGNRYLFGLGSNYKYSKNLDLEFGYMYVNVAKTKINNKSIIPPAPNAILENTGEETKINGSAKASAHLIGMQFSLNTDDLW